MKTRRAAARAAACAVARVVVAVVAVVAVVGGCECARGRPLSMDCVDVAGAGVEPARVCRTALTPSTEDGVDDVVTYVRGRGDHYACRPEKKSALVNGLLIHLVGTGDDPSSDDGFAERACASGFAAVAPMYENRKASREVCPGSSHGSSPSSGPGAADADACFEAYHREILFGERSDLDGVVDVDEKNSVRSRVQSLLDALADDDADFAGEWSAFAKAFHDGDMSAMTLSGHSQGNGHALYWAREQQVARLVLLSGVADHLGDSDADAAPPSWLAHFPDVARSDPAGFFTFVNLDENALTSVVVSAINDAAAGIVDEECIYPVSPPLPAGCHRVVVLPSGCGPVDAHLSVVARTWGPRCEPGGAAHDNAATWAALLTAPAAAPTP